MATATKRQTFDAMADGFEITAASQTATSGDQIDGLLGTGDKTVQTSAAVRGARGLHIGGSDVSSSINFSGLSATSMSAEIYLDYNSSFTAPTATHQLLQIRDGSASKVSCNWSTTKRLQILNAAGSSIATLNGGAELATGLYRLWLGATKGTTSSNGRLLYRLDNVVTGTVIDNFDDSAQNTGTTNYTEARAGKNNASGISWIDIDDFAYRTGDVAVIDLMKQLASTVTDSVGVTDTPDVTTSGSSKVVTITDSIGVADLPGGQVLTVSFDLVDAVGITDTVDLVPAAGLLGRWCADTLIEGGVAPGPLVSWKTYLGVYEAVQETAASQPTLVASAGEFGGHACVEFDGTADWMRLTGTALDLAKNTGALAVFAVYAMANPAPATGPRDIFALSTGTSSATHRVALYAQSTALATQAAGRRLDTDGLQAVSGTQVPDGHAGVLFARFNWTGATLTLTEDATEVGVSEAFQSTGNTSNTSSVAGAIGARASGTGEYFAGRLADLLIYSDADATRQAQVQEYLSARYGLALTAGVTVEGGSLSVAVITATSTAEGAAYSIVQTGGPTVSPTLVAGTEQTWVVPRHVTDERVYEVQATVGGVTRSATVTVAPYDPNAVASSSQLYAAVGANGSTSWEPLASLVALGV